VSKETKGEVGHRTVVHKLTHTHTHTPKQRETGRKGQGGQRERGTYRISKGGLGIIRHDAERRLARALHPFLRISLPLPSCSCCLLLLSSLLSRCFHLMLSSSSSSSSYTSSNTYNLFPHNCRERLQRPTNPTNPQTLDPYAKANWSLNPNPYSQSGLGPEVRLRSILVLSMTHIWINK
jgi:hypothetical protein